MSIEGYENHPGKVERIAFMPPLEVLKLGTPKRFTLRGAPTHSVLRPERLRANSPVGGFVSITRCKFGDQIHFEASTGHVDSYDLRDICETILSRGGFHTLSAAVGVEIDCVYSGACPKPFERGHEYKWVLKIIGPGILVVAL
jgi:hypothetical protein